LKKIIKIGTRESQLAVWQATLVQNLLQKNNIASELVYIKSEGDIDTITPLYEIGVQGIFTKSLDAALINNRIDIAVHSMKDVPTLLAKGIKQAAVLKRGSHKDIFVPHPDLFDVNRLFGPGEIEVNHLSITDSKSKASAGTTYENTGERINAVIATSSVRRIAQWLHRYRHHQIENLRGNVNTRLRKLKESTWHGAIFAAAGLERLSLRPANAIELDWMLPAPAQGAIMVVCREGDNYAFESCQFFNDQETALCTKIERDFLSALLGGCSTPISALAEVKNNEVIFKGNIVSPDTYQMAEYSATCRVEDSADLGFNSANKLLSEGGQAIIDHMKMQAQKIEMKKDKLKILSTKELTKATISKALINDIVIDELPFITTEPINTDELKKTLKEFLQRNIAAVFTSKNAVKAFNQIANAEVPWKIFCIGHSTKTFVAKLFGEEKISGVADNAADLADIILKDEKIKKVIFFSGKQRRDELPLKIKAQEIEVEEIVVYETLETPQKLSRKIYDGILFFSPSAVNSFFSLNKISRQTQIFAIGKTTADAIRQHINKELIIAETPSEENMIEQVRSHFSTTKTA